MSYGYDGRHREPWQDTMQVCPNGHVINDSFARLVPISNKDFCDKCGKKTITNCPKCDKPIPGDIHYPNVSGGALSENGSGFLRSCGEPFPWKGKPIRQNGLKRRQKTL